MRAVLDTNVLIAGLRSNTGASFELLRLLRAGKWTIVLSNTVLAEYEEVVKREAANLGLTLEDADRFLDAVCLLADKYTVSEPWIPILTDPSDEAFAQLAYEARVDCLVTHNKQHLGPAARLGIRVLAPKEFLRMVRAMP